MYIFLCTIHRYNAIANVQNQPPPPPYQQPSFSMNATTLIPTFGIQQQSQCPLHQTQPCTCVQNPTEVSVRREREREIDVGREETATGPKCFYDSRITKCEWAIKWKLMIQWNSFIHIPIFDVRCLGDVSIVYIAIVSPHRIATKFQSSYQFNQITSNQ